MFQNFIHYIMFGHTYALDIVINFSIGSITSRHMIHVVHYLYSP